MELSDLPPDLIREIISKVLDSKIRLRLVCREWHDVIFQLAIPVYLVVGNANEDLFPGNLGYLAKASEIILIRDGNTDWYSN
jgi:hypothetical protein